jgi:hypothetical protein
MGHKGVEDVNSVADFWSWVSNGLVPLIFQQGRTFHEGYNETDEWYENNTDVPMTSRGVWLTYNRIVGGIRLRQQRSKNIGCESVKALLPVYDMSCVGGLGYELDPEIRNARFTSDSVREVWLYTYSDLADLQQQVWALEQTKWLDRLTMKVEASIPAYNGELGLHVMIYVNFFFSRGGHIWKKLMPLGFAAQWHPHWYYWIGDFIWMFCVLYIFVSELGEMWGVIKRKGISGIKTEYISFWNAFDWFSLFCAFVVMGMFGAVMNMVNGLNDSLEALKDPIRVGHDAASYKGALDLHTELLEAAVAYVNTFRYVMAAYPLIIILRLFKAYASQPRLAMVTKTLESSGQELVEFGLVFFSVFITITISGVVLFGREVKSFGTLGRAVFASFRMLIGDLMWDETSKVGRLFAFAWILVFMVVMVMLLLNMLLAIIMKHYVQAKDQAGNAQTLWSEAAQVFRRWRSDRNGHTVPIEKIVVAIEKEDRADEIARALADEEDVHIETDEEQAMRELGKINSIDELISLYAEHTNGGILGEVQAIELMEGAVESFYHRNHSAIDMDEVLKLTHKVEYRTQKLYRMSRQLDKKNPCPNEVNAMSDFLTELETFTDELRSQCNSHRDEVNELRTLKRGLLLQLQTRQALMSGVTGEDHEAQSVNALLATGEYARYDWKLTSRFSDDPLEIDLDTHERPSRDFGHVEDDDEEPEGPGVEEDNVI